MAKRSYLSQSDVPKYSLEEAQKVAQGIIENYAGDPTAPLQVASAIDIKPSSSNFRDICGASIAYGLTNGGYNASKIELTPLAKQIFKPTEEGQETEGLLKAGMTPRVLKEFFSKYNNAKFPKDSIAKNVLEGMGVPNDKLDTVLDIIKDNGSYLGILKEIKGSSYVLIDSPSISPTENDQEGDQDLLEEPIENGDQKLNGPEEELPAELLNKLNISKPETPPGPPATEPKEKPKIFITHGKNKKIVEQIKELLSYGQFEPVVSVEKETTARPVPEKVFEDMRSCQAAVIHVENERELQDPNGKTVKVLNSNVLIEIGAAMALYGKKFILLCQKEVELPSNLQGLYRCNYEGDGLDYEATMKLLKSFNEMRD